MSDEKKEAAAEPGQQPGPGPERVRDLKRQIGELEGSRERMQIALVVLVLLVGYLGWTVHTNEMQVPPPDLAAKFESRVQEEAARWFSAMDGVAYRLGMVLPDYPLSYDTMGNCDEGGTVSRLLAGRKGKMKDDMLMTPSDSQELAIFINQMDVGAVIYKYRAYRDGSQWRMDYMAKVSETLVMFLDVSFVQEPPSIDPRKVRLLGAEICEASDTKCLLYRSYGLFGSK